MNSEPDINRRKLLAAAGVNGSRYWRMDFGYRARRFVGSERLARPCTGGHYADRYV